MREKFQVSVAMTAYNGEEWIAEQVNSWLNQTLPPDEIIICDDSSNSATREVLVQFFGNPKVKYFKNPITLGVYRNFEKAISVCQGDIIFLSDQDDVTHSQKIEKYCTLFACDNELDGIFCNSQVVDDKLNKMDFTLWDMRCFTKKMQKQIRNNQALTAFLKRVTLSAHNIAFRNRCLKLLLPFPELGVFYADTWIGLQIATCGRWQFIDECLTLYRVHKQNSSSPQLAGIKEQAKLAKKALAKRALACTESLAISLILRLPLESDPLVKTKIYAFQKHYQNRQKMSKNLSYRLFLIGLEFFSLRYFRYSNGIKSIAVDLFLR